MVVAHHVYIVLINAHPLQCMIQEQYSHLLYWISVMMISLDTLLRYGGSYSGVGHTTRHTVYYSNDDRGGVVSHDLMYI